LCSPGRKTKPQTIELRVMDSNLPEFVMATVTLIKAASLAWLLDKRAGNKITHAAYLRSRREAAEKGMEAKLCWNGRWMRATDYLDRFVWTYRAELQRMDVPEELWVTLKLLKRGINGATLISEAARRAYDEHPQTWQRRFASRYATALDHLLAGNTLHDFASRLKVPLPETQRVWLGRERLNLA
jgi:gamma-glutamyl:cysteine ligase YbdK (ATP-grasp superfamily)